MLKFLSFFHFFFNMQSIIGKNFSQLPLAVSGSSRIWWTLTIWGDKGSFRGHKTIWATTPSAQIASVVFLCCLTICSQEKHKMLFSLWKILARFFFFLFFFFPACVYWNKKKKNLKRKQKKSPEKLQNFSLQITSVVKNATEDFTFQKYQLHELWVNVDPSEMRIRPNLLIITLNSYKIIFHFSGTNPQIVLLISRNMPGERSIMLSSHSYYFPEWQGADRRLWLQVVNEQREQMGLWEAAILLLLLKMPQTGTPS